MNATSGVLESMKEPLENREWYNYPGDPWPGITGTSDQPSKIAGDRGWHDPALAV